MKTVINEKQLNKIIERLAFEIIEKEHDNFSNLAIIGIKRRGDIIGKRIKDIIKNKEGVDLLFGALDITFYRDDFSRKFVHPSVEGSEIPFDVEDKEIILVDDVVHTGRTIRAAIEAIFSFGRPKKIKVLAIIDRIGEREIPCFVEYKGRQIQVEKNISIEVHLKEIDKDEGVFYGKTLS